MLDIENLSCSYGKNLAVDKVSLSIEQGSFVGIIGRSGAGKSTLLRLINRLTDHAHGHIFYNGQDITALKGRDLRDWRANCAMIFQQFNLAGRLDVLTNVLLGRLNKVPAGTALLRLWSKHDRAMALAALDAFEMGDFAAQRADSLSGGQQQRVAIARALVQNPQIVLADEPIASLDPRNTKRVMDALLRMNKEFGITILCNLHSLDLARSYCDRLVGMAAGKIVFDGQVHDLTNDVARQLYGLEAGEVMDTTSDHGDALRSIRFSGAGGAAPQST